MAADAGLICLRGVHKAFGELKVLEGVDLDISRGESLVIIGSSGTGKSVLIKHIIGLLDPDAGKVMVDGLNVPELRGTDIRNLRQRMGMLFQYAALFDSMSVGENVAFPIHRHTDWSAEKIRDRVAEVLGWVGLTGTESKSPAELSGGMKKRVGLARALCTDAEILLMDEAFSALDPLIRSEMQDQLIELQETLHKTIIFITHDLDEALRLGDRIAILKDGELIQEDTPVEILLNPADSYVEAFVKDVNRARALTVETVMKPPICRITADTIGEALAQMKKMPTDYGYYINQEGYQGVVSQEALEAAAEEDGAQQMDAEILEDIDSILPDALLESVIPETLDTDYPLPVVDAEGETVFRGTRVALCRCGDSEHKPFCDGKHVEAEFTDSGGIAKAPPTSDGATSGSVTVTVAAGGPLLMAGPYTVIGADGAHTPCAEKGALCRCGGSSTKPMCDGTHKTIDFHD